METDLTPNKDFDFVSSKRYVSKWFADDEFRRCSPQCRREDMNDDLICLLDKLRSVCGFPLTLTCAYRSPDYDRRKGRSGTSWHCKGCAVDIYCDSSAKRFVIVRYAISLGFTGVGIGENFVHLDMRPVPCMWHYYKEQ